MELALNNRTDDLLRRDADIAVRMTRPKQDGLIARKLGEVPLGLYAHRDYAGRHGLPLNVKDLVTFHVIGFDRDDHSARAVAGGKLPISRDIFSFRTDSDVAQLFAIRAGLGIGMMQRGMAEKDPALVPVLADQIVITLDCWLAVHEDQRASPPIRAVFDGLAEGLTTWLATNR
jgi:DNA-binding transcriptional LysR family regulator